MTTGFLLRPEVAAMTGTRDQDRSKGAVEQEDRYQLGNSSMQGQIGHRDQHPMLKAADTDFPERGETPQHSGALKDSAMGNLDDVA
jgi:hypothetical protein